MRSMKLGTVPFHFYVLGCLALVSCQEALLKEKGARELGYLQDGQSKDSHWLHRWPYVVFSFALVSLSFFNLLPNGSLYFGIIGF